jgi:predicted unusual protein kinase regulating ubiquinone biosynthesis (AarF/ABC1/UbiB family)
MHVAVLTYMHAATQHPGNLLVTPSGALAILDHGCVT